MAMVLTENQVLLKGYLKEVGCNMATVAKIIFDTWEPEQTIKMLEFCRDNPEASPAELSAMSSEISLQNGGE